MKTFKKKKALVITNRMQSLNMKNPFINLDIQLHI